MIKAVIFDMDGVIFDSEQYHIKSFVELFRRHGVKLSKRDTSDIFGRLDEHIIASLCSKKRITCPIYSWGREKRAIVVEAMKRGTMKLFSGALPLIKSASKKSLIGLATSSSHDELHVILTKAGLNRAFDVVLGREDVRTHKPSPEIYRKAAKLLCVKPSECVVIEDSITGVESAKRAKMKCIAVTNSFFPAKLKRADLIVSNLSDKRVRRMLGC